MERNIYKNYKEIHNHFLQVSMNFKKRSIAIVWMRKIPYIKFDI